mmetsp:Transcript_25510/g.53435  ORF Transcript_25510/g.53435 Transcript_25510/m.53435 type:complete len:355 (+) Transcript_25510:44-1108(+)
MTQDATPYFNLSRHPMNASSRSRSNQGRRAGKSSNFSLLAVIGVIAISAWAYLESTSSINTYIRSDDEAGLSRRSLSEAVGENTSLTSDADASPKEPTQDEDAAEVEPLQKFIIVSQQRSGTRLLTSLLDKHSSIRCGHDDLFLRLHHGPLHKLIEEGTVDEYMDQVHLSMEILPRLLGDNVDGELTDVGFAIMYHQGVTAFHANLFHALKEEGVKIIHLVRKNKLMQYVTMDSHYNSNGTVSGDVDKVLDFLLVTNGETIYVDDLIFAEYGEDGFHTVYYEDLANNEEKEMNRIFDYLNVAHEVVESEFVETHGGKKAREYFAEDDREKVEEAIKESEYEFMLEPDLPGYPGW